MKLLTTDFNLENESIQTNQEIDSIFFRGNEKNLLKFIKHMINFTYVKQQALHCIAIFSQILLSSAVFLCAKVPFNAGQLIDSKLSTHIFTNYSLC